MAPQVIIDATKSKLQYLGSLIEWVCSLKHLVPSWQCPCTHKTGFWCHHIFEDVEDLVDGAKDPEDGVEDPGDGVEAPVDDGESLDGLEKH